MVRADSKQIVYLDLSDEDNVTYYDGAGGGVSGWVERVERAVAGLME